MKINGSYVFPATAEEVWDLLLDPQVLMQVIPGLQKVEVHGDDILATAMVGIGPVKGVFSGKLTLLDKQQPTHVRIVGEGKGRPGFMTGVCILDASEHDGQTTVKYQAEIHLGGTLGLVGQRLVDAATQSIMQQGFGAFNRVLRERKAAEHDARRVAELITAGRATRDAAVQQAQAIQAAFPRRCVVGLPAMLAASALVLALGH